MNNLIAQVGAGERHDVRHGDRGHGRRFRADQRAAQAKRRPPMIAITHIKLDGSQPTADHRAGRRDPISLPTAPTRDQCVFPKPSDAAHVRQPGLSIGAPCWLGCVSLLDLGSRPLRRLFPSGRRAQDTGRDLAAPGGTDPCSCRRLRRTVRPRPWLPDRPRHDRHPGQCQKSLDA